jgi:transposase
LGDGARCAHGRYSLDLRKKIVEAKERGMPTGEVARAFDVSVSTIKR